MPSKLDYTIRLDAVSFLMMMSMLRKRVTAVRLVRGFKTLTSGEPLTVRSISVDAIGDPAKVLKYVLI